MTCESCGADEPQLTSVHRIYPTVGESGGDMVQPDVEEWCFACMTHYPHERVGP